MYNFVTGEDLQEAVISSQESESDEPKREHYEVRSYINTL